MGKVRRCDKRCHTAKHPRCRCWCGGAFHSNVGAANRQAVVNGATELLEKHGFKKGETVYLQQGEFPIP